MHCLLTAIDLTSDSDLAILKFCLTGECALRVVTQRSQHLAYLIVVGIDRQLAKNDQVDAFFFDNGFENFGDCQRLNLFLGLNQNAAIRTQRQSGTQLLLSSLRANGDGNDFIGCTGFFQANGFFNGDFTKRINRHLGIGQINTGSVRIDPDSHIRIYDALNSHKNLHGFPTLNSIT